MIRLLLTFLAISSATLPAEQSDYYTREVIPLPEGTVPEIGSIALLPDQRLAISTRRGEIWICSGAYDDDLSKVTWQRFAYGLESSFGMYWKNDALYLTQRSDFSRFTDRDNNGEADRIEVISQDWGFEGDYHQFAFGSEPDKNGDTWIALCELGGASKWRGWALKISPDGTLTPVTSGLRSPGGIGFNAAGDAFYTDNQGSWNGTSSVRHLKPDTFLGHPSSLRHYKLLPDQTPPLDPVSGTRITDEIKRNPRYYPPSVLLPHGKMGTSPTAVVLENSGGKFGPFANNLLIGEQSHTQIQRVFTEQINGIYQGAAWHFLNGFECGIVPARLATDGTLFVGGTNRGWGSRGTRGYTLERVRWTGTTPFEATAMRARPNGFQLTFTEPLDPKTAFDPASYSMEAWTYIYQSSYGSPEVDKTVPVVKSATLSNNNRTLTLKVKGLVQGHLHQLNAPGLLSASGKKLWHPTAYYTLNQIPR